MSLKSCNLGSCLLLGLLIVVAAAPASAAREAASAPSAALAVDRERLVDSAYPEQSIPDLATRQQDPLRFGYFLMELIDKAAAAFNAQDYERAARFYRAMAKAVPERAAAWSRLCEIHQRTGELVQAEAACLQAIRRPGTLVRDRTAYVELYLNNHRAEFVVGVALCILGLIVSRRSRIWANV
jgi:hypothetical protein